MRKTGSFLIISISVYMEVSHIGVFTWANFHIETNVNDSFQCLMLFQRQRTSHIVWYYLSYCTLCPDIGRLLPQRFWHLLFICLGTFSFFLHYHVLFLLPTWLFSYFLAKPYSFFCGCLLIQSFLAWKRTLSGTIVMLVVYLWKVLQGTVLFIGHSSDEWALLKLVFDFSTGGSFYFVCITVYYCFHYPRMNKKKMSYSFDPGIRIPLHIWYCVAAID